MASVMVINEEALTLNDILNNEKLIEHLVIDIDTAIEYGDKYFTDSNYYKTKLKVINSNNTSDNTSDVYAMTYTSDGISDNKSDNKSDVYAMTYAMTYTIFYGYYGENWIGCVLLENNDIIGLGDQFNDDCLIPDMIAINSWFLNFMETEESHYI